MKLEFVCVVGSLVMLFGGVKRFEYLMVRSGRVSRFE